MLKELFKDEEYKDNSNNLRNYAYQEYISKPTAKDWEYSFGREYSWWEDPYKPLLDYFNEGKYVSFIPTELRGMEIKGSIPTQYVIAYSNDLEECLKDTISFYNKLKQYPFTFEFDMYIATRDGMVKLSSSTNIDDFKEFNLTNAEMRVLRKAVVELSLS